MQKLNDIFKNILYVFFISWIYINFFTDILNIFINSSIVIRLKYICLIVLMLISLVINGFKIKKNILLFFIMYFFVLFLNITLVDYKYYVFIEGCTSFLIFMLPMYLLSYDKFDFNELLIRWYKFAIKSFPLVAVLIVLYKMQIIKYDVFDNILLPNILILSFYYYYKKENIKKLKTMIMILIYIVGLILFASRMSAIACVFIMFFNALWSKRKNSVKTLVIAILFTVIFISIINNLDIIVNYTIKILQNFNIRSRTLFLLKKQIESGALFQNIYLSNREVIYSLAIDFITSRSGLPGGFAVIPNLTQGYYYHAHNLLLQLCCFFGIIGAIFIALIILYKLKKLKYNSDENVYDFCFMLFVFYLVYSLANANFLTSFISIMFIGILFFKNSLPISNGGGNNEDK